MEEQIVPLNVIKIGLLGDSDVGKSAIRNSLMGLEFSYSMQLTVGFEKFEKKVILNNGKNIKLIILDSSGQERNRSFAFSVLKSIIGIVLVFTVKRKKSFDDLNILLEQIKDNFDNSYLILFGNQVDEDKTKWEVTSEEASKFAKEKGMAYFEVSAKTGKGINEGFEYFANEIYDKINKKIQNKKEIEINDKKIIKTNKKSDCVKCKKSISEKK